MSVHDVTRDFTLDRFQLEAMDAIDAGRSVLVSAPTSSGKTLVAEHAIDSALKAGKRTFYTTPIKALSNQKFRDLGQRLGWDKVGLLTGDNNVNGDAPVVVMTTEVLRNMLYAGSSAVDNLGWVVLDEVHFLEDPYRGPVWEEVILGLDRSVGVVALSATVSNADELGDWLRAVRGEIEVVVERKRPVPLKVHYMVTERRKYRRLHRIPVLVEDQANPQGRRFDSEGEQGGHRGQRSVYATPRRDEVLEELQKQELLPSIHFIFSRAGCDEARDRVLQSGISLNTPEETAAVEALLQERLARVDADDLSALEVDQWAAGLCRGVASHHAGLVPLFKEITEELFIAGLLKMVYATETLALGVNLPARSVVIDKLTKFTGEGHEMLTPGQFTQLTGRAGRRGLDTIGHALVLWSPFVRFPQVSGLTMSSEFVLRSAFRPTYNMVANLMHSRSQSEAEGLLGRSFGQFQVDRQTALSSGRQEVAERELKELQAVTTRNPEKRGKACPVASLRPGDVVVLDDGLVHGVISVANRKGGRVKLRTINEKNKMETREAQEINLEPRLLDTIFIPKVPDPSVRLHRREVAALLSPYVRGDASDDGKRQRRIFRLKRDIKRMQKQAEGESLVARMAATTGVLEERGLADGWALTAAGIPLTRIYNEADLVVVEALNNGLFDGLNPAELAGVVSTLTYGHRGPGESGPLRMNGPMADRLHSIAALWEEIAEVEERYGLPSVSEPDHGFAEVIHGWAAGGDLDQVLDQEINGGEFVRNVRLVVDLIGQLRKVGPPALRRTAGEAIEALERGVVNISAALGTDEGEEETPDEGEEEPPEEVDER